MDTRTSCGDERPSGSLNLYWKYVSVFQNRNSNAVPPTYFEFYHGYRNDFGGDNNSCVVDRPCCVPPLLEGAGQGCEKRVVDEHCGAVGGDQPVPVVGDLPGDGGLPGGVKNRGKHYKKNLARRQKRVEAGRALEKVDNSGNSNGFWGMCSPEKRRLLADSKADMHIAENMRRARIARDAVAKLDSPEAIVRKAIAMIKLAENCAAKESNPAIAGWAATVATSYAESVARSAPSSVPSYASVVSGKTSASSVSVDGTKRKLGGERFEAYRERLDKLQNYREAAQLQRELDQDESLLNGERESLLDFLLDMMNLFQDIGQM